MNKREKLLKHFKVIAILFVISIIFEGVIYAYNIFINKFYNQKNLTGNTPIEISNSELEFSEIDEYGYGAITYNKKLQSVSNVELITKPRYIYEIFL